MAVLGLALAGCASSHFGDLPVVGLPASTPARPEVQPAYLPVDDTPASRSQSVLTPEEQDKVARDLTAARDRQSKITGKSPSQSPQQ
ncbi:MAG: hypothetical protein K2W78_08835 [Xanthobacteraceae bacterium]|nr:hypothetical protein [Xanthobacteraceae bacterium]